MNKIFLQCIISVLPSESYIRLSFFTQIPKPSINESADQQFHSSEAGNETLHFLISLLPICLKSEQLVCLLTAAINTALVLIIWALSFCFQFHPWEF